MTVIEWAVVVMLALAGVLHIITGSVSDGIQWIAIAGIYGLAVHR